MKKTITRRDFMKKSTTVIAGVAAGINLFPTDLNKSRIILIRHPQVLDENFTINGTILQQMFEEGLMALLNKKDPLTCFQTIIKKDDVVGIKSNKWNYLPTPTELEQAIKNQLTRLGVKEENISIDDHGVRDNPVFQRSTALINVRPLRTHYLAGMSGCMKNYITFAENYPDYHPNNCANLALLFNLPQVKGKTRLHILSLLTPQFHGLGPHHFNRRFVWDYKGLLLGTDPVSMDRVALEILLAKRKEFFGPRDRLSPMPRYIEIADKTHGLGNSDLQKIEIIKLGWTEGILI